MKTNMRYSKIESNTLIPFEIQNHLILKCVVK